MLGAGMVIIQPATANVVLIHEAAKNFWFLPKGRKDVGESLEQAVLREAHEESGYHASFLPVRMPTNAPSAPATPHARSLPCTEPFYVSTLHWRPQPHRADVGGEYFTFWYLGQIEADAVPERKTGMPDEAHYQAHVLKLRQALDLLEGCGMKDLARILLVGYTLWEETRQWELAHASSRAEVQAGRQHAGRHVQGYRGSNGQP